MVANRAPCLLGPLCYSQTSSPHFPLHFSKVVSQMYEAHSASEAHSCSSLCSAVTLKSFMGKVCMSEFAQDSP